MAKSTIVLCKKVWTFLPKSTIVLNEKSYRFLLKDIRFQ